MAWILAEKVSGTKIQRICNIAKKQALRSSHQHKLGAVIFKHGKPISKGYNQTHRGLSRSYGHWEGSLHAEIDALISARTSVKGSSILVARSTGGIARPCAECMAAIKQAGIKWVYYTDGLSVDKERV